MILNRINIFTGTGIGTGKKIQKQAKIVRTGQN